MRAREKVESILKSDPQCALCEACLHARIGCGSKSHLNEIIRFVSHRVRGPQLGFSRALEICTDCGALRQVLRATG